MTPSLEIRPVLPSDAVALGSLHLRCWAEAYEDLVDPARLAPYLADVEGAVRRWHEVLAGPARVRVADDGGRLVGFATVRPGPEGGPVHLGALYLRKGRWSTGLGQRLLDAALGSEPATLNVLRDNVRAVRFYRRNGFVPDGVEAEEPHWGGVEIGMVRTAQDG